MIIFFPCLVGIVELLLTMEVVHDITETPNVNPNQMIYALGLANFAAGFFGTIGGGAMIGLSVLVCRR